MLITLPRESLKYLDDKIVQVEVDAKSLKKEMENDVIKKTKGLLKKYKIDGSEYQNQIRKEWDRNLGSR